MNRRALLTFLLLLSSLGAAAFTYRMSPAAPPALLPGTEDRPLLLLAPFEDRRTFRAVRRADSQLDEVWLEPEGRTTLARAWQDLRSGDVSLLVHAQSLAGLAAAGFHVTAAAEPMPRAAILAMARGLSASAAVVGQIRRLETLARGNDLLGTSFSGMRYVTRGWIELQALDPATGKTLWEGAAEEKREMVHEGLLAADEEHDLPLALAAFLPGLGARLAAVPGLRRIGGVPAPSPTATMTATPTLAAGPAPAAAVPVRKCPKCGRGMDPAWKVCPFDGATREQFIPNE